MKRMLIAAPVAALALLTASLSAGAQGQAPMPPSGPSTSSPGSGAGTVPGASPGTAPSTAPGTGGAGSSSQGASPGMPAANSPATTPSASPSDADLIASAMLAAPSRVALGAAIVTMGADGQMRTLREGRNGFTCMPDNPATPGPDPMCMDAAAMEWVMAWVGRRAPTPGRLGLMYMLKGGTDASNTDPYAVQPTGDNAWIQTGPHVMIVGADAAFYDQYPKSATPDTSMPYVMWPGTPYQHLMIPVQ